MVDRIEKMRENYSLHRGFGVIILFIPRSIN